MKINAGKYVKKRCGCVMRYLKGKNVAFYVETNLLQGTSKDNKILQTASRRITINYILFKSKTACILFQLSYYSYLVYRITSNDPYCFHIRALIASLS